MRVARPGSAVRAALALLLAGTCAVAPDASAKKPAPKFQDSGAMPARDPYTHDSQLSQGPLEGFRRLYVDPATFPASLGSASPTERGELRFRNHTSAYVVIEIKGQKVGQIRPYDEVILRNVRKGTYEIRMVHPNGFAWTETHTAK